MDNHQISYMFNPTYLERRFGVPPLRELLVPDVVGIARIIVMPAFSSESVYTLIYRANRVYIESRCAEDSLWYSESKSDWVPPISLVNARNLDDLPIPLNDWRLLKDAALSAPTVKFAMIGGEKVATLDGVGYRHSILDHDLDLYAEWSNPDVEASNHVHQVRLVKAYEKVLKWWE